MKVNLGLLKRIMFLLPVFLCIAIASIVVVKHTRTRYPVSVTFDQEPTRYDEPAAFVQLGRRTLPKPGEQQGEASKEMQKGKETLQEALKKQTE